MAEINDAIKRIRKKKKFTQKSISERLHMARSTYTKIETGATELSYKVLVSISKVLDIPVREIIGEKGDPIFDEFKDEFSFMLHSMEYHLTQKLVKTIPFDELSKEHIDFLIKRGCFERDYYESSSETAGRIYAFSPDDVFRFMLESCGMSMLFEKGLIKNDYLLSKWKKRDKELPKIQFDEVDYFLVFIMQLSMPESEDIHVQVAQNDFPDGMDEDDVLGNTIMQLGALTGDILAMTYEGYAPYIDILRINSGCYTVDNKLD